ncbi:hypothetical protein KR074_010797, partial [Drosophila pseudoananassae]
CAKKVEKSYESCSDLLAESGDNAAISTVLESKYSYCYYVYSRCIAQLREEIASHTTPASVNVHTPASTGCRLPPVDTEVFAGDYLRWPTFRDLFTAIYIQNSRLTPVERWFHLLSKTSGDAHAIVSKAPLTHEGFDAAWQSLTDRFENRRLLVNSQLKILFNIQAISQESGVALKELQATIQSCLTALAMSSINVEAWDCLLVFMISSRLPKVTLSMWEQSVHNKAEIPTWKELDNFLTERHCTLEAIDDVRPSGSGQLPPRSGIPIAPARRLNSHETRVVPGQKGCDLCSREDHPIRLCPRFLNMDVNGRFGYITRKQLCLNCFGRGHQQRDCTSARTCFTCHSRHHTLLHRGNPFATAPSPPMPPTAPSPPTPANRSEDQSNVQVCFASGSGAVILGTALINVCHLGCTVQARALIDSGSEATFITERLFNLVKPPFKTIQAQVSGLNQTISAQSTKLCHFSIRSPSRPGLQLETAAYVLPQLAGNLPSYPISRDRLKGLPNITLADPNFFESSQVDVLLGADILPSILLGNSKSNICGS